MEIQTYDQNLVDELEDSAPEGVSVVPMMTRSGDPEKITTVILYFAANVDVARIAIWLLEKLKDKPKTTIISNNTSIEFKLGPLSMAIKNEFKSEKRETDRN